jgi:hypothetical protein
MPAWSSSRLYSAVILLAYFLRDHFALFGEAHVALDGARGQAGDETVGRSGAAADGPAAAMEETDADPVLLSPLSLRLCWAMFRLQRLARIPPSLLLSL